MRYFTFAYFLVISGFPLFVSAQTNPEKEEYWKKVQDAKHDTVRALALLDYGGLFCFTNYDTAEYYYRQARHLSLKHNFYRGYQKWISYQSEIYNLKGLFDSNVFICREGLLLAQQKKDYLFQGTHSSNIGAVHLYKTNNDSAGWYFLQASRFFEAIKDSLRLGQVYSNLAIVFDNLEQYEQSLHYNKLALNIAKASGDELGVGYAMVNMGAVYKKQQKLDSARYYFEKALPIAQQNKDINLEKDVTIDLGFIELTGNQLSKAEQFFLRGLALSNQLHHDYGIVSSKKGLAALNLKKKDFRSAESLLNEIIALSNKNGFREELQELYWLNYEAAQGNANYKAALEAYINHIQLKDSLNNLQVQKNIATLEKQYQAERKEKLLLQKDSQIKNQQLQLQSKNVWILILTSLVFLIGIICFLVWKVYKQKRLAEIRQQELLQVQLAMQAKEEERHRIARELHDDLGGTLSGIIVQTHFMGQQVEHHNVTALQKSIEKITHAASEMITKLNDIIWLVNPKYDTLEKLVQRIEEFAMDMARAKGMEVRIKASETIEPIALDTEARKNIYLICKEAINNAVKYSQASQLHFTVDKTGQELKLSIEDNGQGFDEAMIRLGNGLHNMRERAITIGADYSINAANKKGTCVTLNYKIPQ